VLRRLARIIAALLVVAVAAAAGVYVAAGLAPERLRAEVERLLTMATEGPVSMGNLRLVVGFPLHLDARDLRIWGGALTVERASARIDVFALVTGRVRLSRLSLDGAHLRIQRGSDGSWSPPWLQRHTPAPEPAPEPALMPLLTIDAVVRFLLERPLLADTLQVARSRVSYVHDFSDSGGAVVALWLEGVHGRLQHSRLLGDAELSLHARLVAEDGPGGSFEWEGARTRKTGMRLTMAATEFELETLVPFLTPGPSPGQLSGRLSGVIDYTVAESEQGRLDLDLVTRDFGLGAGLASADPFAADHLATRMRVHIDPHHLEVSRARIQRGDLEFDLEAVVSRPLGRDSNTALTLSMQDVDLARARGLIEWLPEATRDEASAVADSVLAGRIPSMQAHGAARLEDWQGLMTGSAKVLPRALRIAVDVEDVAIAVDESDRLEHVTGTLAWSEDRLTAHHVNGDLNGEPLPTLDLEISGVGHLLASERRWRLIPSGAVPLAGLTPLWEFLQPADPESESNGLAPRVVFELDHLDHPAFLWPLDDVRATFEPNEHGANVRLDRALWAGVPLRGAIAYDFVPERRIVGTFEAGPIDPESGDASEDTERLSAAVADQEIDIARAAGSLPARTEPVWAEGRFSVAAIERGPWRQRTARGRFRAMRGEIHLEEVEVALSPEGQVAGRITLDLAHGERVPYELNFTLVGGDTGALLHQWGFEGQLATGSLDLRGGLAGTLRPGRALFEGVSGLLMLEASDGVIHRSVPPLLAVALASETFSGFTNHEDIRYTRCITALLFDDGRVSTDAFNLDGPDLRLFASGRLDLAHPPHSIEAEVVLFLFRQIDRAIEKIPILNSILLGENENLVAAYYELEGPWEEPVAKSRPLRTLREGPGSSVIQGIPRVVERGVRAIGELLGSAPASEDAPGALPGPASLQLRAS
jgi:hypothetical protein